MSEILFWVGIGVMIASTVFSLTVGRLKTYATYAYGVGLVIVTVATSLYPHGHEVTKWTAVVLLGLFALVYLFAPAWSAWHTKTCTSCKERYTHAREEVEQGQGDGEVPEGARRQEDK